MLPSLFAAEVWRVGFLDDAPQVLVPLHVEENVVQLDGLPAAATVLQVLWRFDALPCPPEYGRTPREHRSFDEDLGLLE